jgi:hypothetical protein
LSLMNLCRFLRVRSLVAMLVPRINSMAAETSLLQNKATAGSTAPLLKIY